MPSLLSTPDSGPAPTDREIVAARPPKNRVDPQRPYAYFLEQECSAAGQVDDVATIFLTNRECAFRCVFCDLWKNTTDETTPRGAIPAQIRVALAELPPARHVKLYNGGNFFDRKAIPPADHPQIARQLDRFETVIVENHPKLCGDACLRFRDRLEGELEIALGLETAHPQVLARLNKRMTLADFDNAARFLVSNGIRVRAFILLQPPFLDPAESVTWAIRSMEFAFDRGVECCAVIPARGGNGIMERLAAAGQFTPPRLDALEATLEAGLAMQRGRVFADLWDCERFCTCRLCAPARRERLHRMNLAQRWLPRVECRCGDPANAA